MKSSRCTTKSLLVKSFVVIVFIATTTSVVRAGTFVTIQTTDDALAEIFPPTTTGNKRMERFCENHMYYEIYGGTGLNGHIDCLGFIVGGGRYSQHYTEWYYPVSRQHHVDQLGYLSKRGF